MANDLEKRLREGFTKVHESRGGPPPRNNIFKDDTGDYLEFETDGKLFWFDITPKSAENKTLQTVRFKKAEFLRLLEYLNSVSKYL